MLIPAAFVGAAVLGGGAYVCSKGVTVNSGIEPLPWRVRFACWRYISEAKIDGVWKRAGTFPLRGRLNAVQLAISTANAEAFGPRMSATAAEPMVRIIRATKVS